MIDESKVYSARRYNYWLGGKDHFAVDRQSGDLIAAAFPTVRTMAVENRGFLRRATEYLAGEQGIRQFLDIGTGLPAVDNTHEVAQRVAPDSRVVYVDNDPMVLVHARALLTSTPEGRTEYLEADLREPGAILRQKVVRETLDLSQPVGLMLIAVLHFIRDTTEAAAVVRTLMDALPAGSYLVVSNATTDFSGAAAAARYQAMIDAGQVDAYPRTAADLAVIFDGFDLVAPGFAAVSDWRAADEPQPRPDPGDVAVYGAVARKIK